MALGRFFREGLFCRIAVVLTRRTVRPETLEPYQVSAGALRNRLVEVVRFWRPLDSIELIVEQSQRGDNLARKYLGDFRYWREIDGKKSYIPVGWHFMPKSAAEPGLEIADFVMHAAGGRTRARLAGRTEGRADFKAVFDEVDPQLVSFIEVHDVVANQ